jgi:GNAT superfamily N-acetyltransferase
MRTTTITWTVTSEDDNEADEHVKKMVRLHKHQVSPPHLFAEDGDPADYESLNIYLRDEQGVLTGALLGGTFWRTLHVHWLWVEEARRNQGHAREMIHRALAEAKKRGCTSAWGNTWQTQGAYSLYDHLGAKIVWKQDFPQVGQSLIWYQVDL